MGLIVEYLLLALAIFPVLRLVRMWVDAPEWFWQGAVLLLSVAGVLLTDSDWEWYSPLSIAGIVAFLQLAENLLIARADESLNSIIRRR